MVWERHKDYSYQINVKPQKTQDNGKDFLQFY